MKRKFVARRVLRAATWVGIAVLLGLGSFLAGCSPSAPAPQASTGTAPASQTGTSAAPAKVTLSYLGRGDATERQMYDGVFAEFEKQNPQIKVDVTWIPNGNAVDQQQKVLTLIAGGAPPDVMWTHTYIEPGLVARGAIMPLDQFMANDKYDSGQFLAPALQDFANGGKLYGLPRETSAMVMVFNRDMLKAHGLSDPKPDWTWNDLISMAKQLTTNEGANSTYGITGMTFDTFMEFVLTWQNGGDVLNDDRSQYTLNQKPGVDAAKFIQDMIWKDKIHPTPDTIKTVGDVMAAGKAGFEPLWSSAFIQLKNAKYEWDVVPLPTNGKKITRVASAGHAILNGTKHPQEAWTLLKFLASPTAFDMFLANGINMPGLKSSFDKVLANPSDKVLLPKNVQVINDAFGYGRGEPVAGNWVGVHSAIISALGNIWGPQQQDPQQALDGAASDVNQLIKALPQADK